MPPSATICSRATPRLQARRLDRQRRIDLVAIGDGRQIGAQGAVRLEQQGYMPGGSGGFPQRGGRHDQAFRRERRRG